ncbi:DUF6351 family protein [Caldimonas brevitalea]|uniref:DUF6351 domain-containing protein n=1 Tax=Caldimonas brevitalea TaxID=413882 RepID=A0A0G3BDF5_9BURK|nr:DUF6351 family protein [Caldimonas brevitalea]AKJ27419.1 hypothetical protein AAW51_0728 [Caldimonas brevitalea]
MRHPHHPVFPLARRLLTCTAVAALAACGGSGSTRRDAEPQALEIHTLSNRADLISGGDVHAEVVLPQGAAATGLKVDVGGRDVSDRFAVRADGRVTGVLTGLAEGANVVTATLEGQRSATLTITNHRRSGPVYSGEPIRPFVCATPTPQGATADRPATQPSGLSGTADANCEIATETKLYYRTTTPGCSPTLPDPHATVPYGAATPPAQPSPQPNLCFKPYDPAAPAPADLASTTTDHGVTVPYVVRVERGTLNRGIYDIAVLFDPARPWSADTPQPQWNGKLYYQFGSSTGQPRRQVRPQAQWTSAANDNALQRGHMVVMNSMTDSATNSNRVLMAETVMMMKEHIADRYGPIAYTMGTGCSGGSINANMNASIAPGQLDGFTIACAYPDSETTTLEVNDCVVLVEAYQKPQWLDLMAAGGLSAAQVNAKKAAINGHPDQSGCHGWYNAFGSNGKVGNYVQRVVVSPDGTLAAPGAPVNNCQLPANQVYDPVANPGGARCSAWDWAASVWGKPAATGRAYDTRDNTGVQYGLKALLSGVLTAEEFVTLNEIVGGVDKDANLQATRSVADPQALDIAYRSGIVLSGKQLARHPVIDMRGWDDSGLIVPPGATTATVIPIHYVWRSFSIRERLDREAGGHANQVMWRFGTGSYGLPPMAGDAFLTMDKWLTALKADRSDRALEQKVVAAKPAEAVDYCLLTASPTTKVYDFAVCDTDPFLKPSSSPRQVAGGPLSENILKCQLKPLVQADYPAGTFSAAQWTRLQSVFGSGVCDWSKPGVGQQDAVGPLSFAAGLGGQPLPAAPRSQLK